MTAKINIDVKFKTPEAAALGFGLLYHAAGVVQSGCRGQLVVGMTDEATADNFIAHVLRDDRAREAAIGLAGRIMEDSLRALADGLELGEETPPIVLDREPAQIVRDGLVEILDRDWHPSLDLVRNWSMEMLESTSAWILALHEERRHGRPDPVMPKALAAALSYDAGMEERREFGVEAGAPSDNRKLLADLGLEPVFEDGNLRYEPARASGSGAQRKGNLSHYQANGEQRVRIVVDSVTMWASTVTVERFEIPPAIGPDDFTEDDGAIEFYADGEYNTTTVERLRLRIESRDEEGGCDFTLHADGELHDGCSTLTEVANSYPNVAPTLDDWKAGRTVPFAVVATAARKLAGLTEPLPEETA